MVWRVYSTIVILDNLLIIRNFAQTASAAIGHGGEFDEPFTDPLRAGFFVIGGSGQAISLRSEVPSEFFCCHLHRLPLDMALLLHQACMTLKRKRAATGTRAPRARSIVGSFFPRPELPSVADSVARAVCHLVLEAARAPLAVIHEGAQNGSRRATTPGEPVVVGTAVPSPRSGV